ncbi:Acg family FMN-binding oxidoreductase [Actinokineospora guangxiensis]|uniref:Acg family FMN-binding oxidoreductase n=1 Tax=Actinokineospora guangxiensis TaxID=1490288 RepID=A0ABW0ELC6_9PSEU
MSTPPWPDAATLTAAIEDACRAPSVHNTQPWTWLVGHRSLHLMADRSRWMRATDAEGRDLVISCGAALHHLRISLAARGWSAEDIQTSDDPDHLAALALRPAARTSSRQALAIGTRRTDRRRYSGRKVPGDVLGELAAAAATTGVLAVAVDQDSRLAVAVALLAGAARQEPDADVRRELAFWSGRAAGGVDGVPAASAPPDAPHHGGIAMRAFPGGELPDPPTGAREPDAGELLVIATPDDGTTARLRAGEAAAAVLLTAEALGLAACPLSQGTEVEPVRAVLRRLLGSGEPQLVIRVGYAPDGAPPLPPTPRRRADEVCHALPGATPAGIR